MMISCLTHSESSIPPHLWLCLHTGLQSLTLRGHNEGGTSQYASRPPKLRIEPTHGGTSKGHITVIFAGQVLCGSMLPDFCCERPRLCFAAAHCAV